MKPTSKNIEHGTGNHTSGGKQPVEQKQEITITPTRNASQPKGNSNMPERNKRKKKLVPEWFKKKGAQDRARESMTDPTENVLIKQGNYTFGVVEDVETVTSLWIQEFRHESLQIYEVIEP